MHHSGAASPEKQQGRTRVGHGHLVEVGSHSSRSCFRSSRDTRATMSVMLVVAMPRATVMLGLAAAARTVWRLLVEGTGTRPPPPLPHSRGQSDAETCDEPLIVTTQMPDHASYCNRATKGQTAHRNGHNRALVQDN